MADAFPLPVANLAETILAANSASEEMRKKIWATIADKSRLTEDPFKAHQGGPTSIIEVRRDLAAKGNGQKVVFPKTGGYHVIGVNGDTPLALNDYAKDVLGSDTVSVDIKKFGHNDSDYNEQNILREILGNVPVLLGEQMGREFYQDAAMTHMHLAHAQSKMILGQTSVDALTANDELDLTALQDASGMMEPRGGKPYTMRVDGNGSVTSGYLFMPTTPAWRALKADPTVREWHTYAAERGASNPLFTGELHNLDGNIIQHFCPIDHSEAGAVSSPYAPRAYLGTAIAGGTSAIDITGGRNATNGALTNVHYFRWFPRNSTYKFLSGSSLAVTSNFWGSASTSYFYVRIDNPRNAVTDPGKWCIYRVTTNDGNKLTMDQRLGASASGARSDTVGSVTWDANVHTVTHASDSMIRLCNASGQPLCCTPGFAQSGLRRAFGIFNNRRGTEKAQDLYNFTYLYSVAGHGLKTDLAGYTPSIANIIHTYKMKGWDY